MGPLREFEKLNVFPQVSDLAVFFLKMLLEKLNFIFE
jgi:hypothetical protein